MANYNYINSRGVIVPDTAELREEVEEEWREAFGDDLVLDPSTPQGVLITAEVEARDGVVRNNAEVANQINPDLAGGIWLDAIWALTRGRRYPAARSVISGAVLGGQAGTIVPAGSLATVEDSNAVFRTTGTVILDSSGTAIANLESVEFGPIASPAGKLNQVATSVLGWETINNPTAAALGRLQESDVESRRRRRQTLALQGVSLPEAILSRLYAIESVRSAVLRENKTGSTAVIDGITLVEHSVYVCVDGGSDLEVATDLLASKSLGANWNGDESVSIIEPFSNQVYTVKFQRPDAIQVFARVTVKQSSLDAQVIVPDAINRYVNGEIEGEEGFVIGSNVNPFEISGSINQVEPRIFVVNIELSTDGTTYSSAPIPVGLDEVARLAAVQVVVV